MIFFPHMKLQNTIASQNEQRRIKKENQLFTCIYLIFYYLYISLSFTFKKSPYIQQKTTYYTLQLKHYIYFSLRLTFVSMCHMLIFWKDNTIS